MPIIGLTLRSKLSKMGSMKRSLGFYIVISGIIVAVVGLLVGLGLTEKWTAFFTIALLAILMFVFLSDIPVEQKRAR